MKFFTKITILFKKNKYSHTIEVMTEEELNYWEIDDILLNTAFFIREGDDQEPQICHPDVKGYSVYRIVRK